MSTIPMQDAALIAVDWGTSAFRAALLARDGQVLATRGAPAGMATVAPGTFAQRFTELVGDWQALFDRVPIYLCGMVGSRQGWVEVRYAECPARLEDLAAAAMSRREGGMRLTFLPGLHVRSQAGDDVMRGEETQLLGSGGLDADRVTVMPGTHSKWVSTRDGAVRGFSTFMTGDLYAAIGGHTILALSLRDRGASDLHGSSFDEGVAQGHETPALTQALFGVRTRSLFDASQHYDAAAYLSGLLIGHELAAGARLYPDARDRGMTLVGSTALTARYARAAAKVGLAAQVADAEASQRGCFLLARFRGDM